MLRTATIALTLLSSASAFAEAAHGEAFTYSFSLGEIEGGRARVAISKPFKKDDRMLVALRGQAETAPWLRAIAPLNDEYQLLITNDDRMPIDVDTIETGKKTRKTHTHFERDGKTADVTVDGGRHSLVGRRNLPDVTRDPVTIYLHLRKRALKNGETFTLHMLDRSYLSKVSFKVVGRETLFLDSAHLKARAIRIEGVGQRIDDGGRPIEALPPRPFVFWLSDDRDQVLLRMEMEADLGKARIEMTSFSKS